MGLYLRPASLDIALDALRERALTIVAGGTDHYPAHVGRPLAEDVLDVVIVTGACYDYIREDDDDPEGGGNAEFLRRLVLGL